MKWPRPLPRPDSWTAAWRTVVFLPLVTVLVAACSDSKDQEATAATETAAAQAADLAPLPALDIETFAPEAKTEFEQAIARVQRLEADARADADGRAWAWTELGRLSHAYSFFDQATPCYANARQLAPSDFAPWYLGAHVDRADGRFEDSNRGFARALELRPGHLPSRYWLAMNALDSGRYDEARGGFGSVLAERPSHAGARLGLAQVELEQGQFADALARLEADQPKPLPTAWLDAQLAAYRGLGDLDAARQVAERMPRSNQERVSFEFNDPLMQAVSDLRQVAQFDSRRAMAAIQRGRYDLAIPLLRSALAKDPKRSDARYNLAASLLTFGQRDEARDLLEQAVERNPEHTFSQVLLARLDLQSGRVEDAEARLLAAVEYDPEAAPAHRGLGDLERRRGQVEAALAHYRRAVEVSPGEASSRVGVVACLADLGRLDAARQALSESREALPGSRALHHLDWRLAALRGAQDARKALAELRASASEGTVSAIDLESEAMLLAGQGRWSEAAEPQRSAIEAYESSSRQRAARRARDRLERFLQSRPPVTIWAYDEAARN